MTTYAIGDLHGCYDELQRLLDLIQFDPNHDRLWFTGDLVNRGPHSLKTLRFIKNLKHTVVTLGNHDIYLLCLIHGHPFKNHNLHDVLLADDRYELADWLRKQPLLHYDSELNYAITHAGIWPSWRLTQALNYARELETILQAPDYGSTIHLIEGREPRAWDEHLTGWDRLRFIANAFTRMRFCTPDGRLDFDYSGEIGSQPPDYVPWYQVENRACAHIPVIFGHWAASQGKAEAPNVFAIDTGCVWGGALTAMRLGDNEKFSVHQ